MILEIARVFKHLVAVSVNFTCQLDGATGCPDIWTHILGMSVRVFQEEINTGKVDYPPQCRWAKSREGKPGQKEG